MENSEKLFLLPAEIRTDKQNWMLAPVSGLCCVCSRNRDHFLMVGDIRERGGGGGGGGGGADSLRHDWPWNRSRCSQTSTGLVCGSVQHRFAGEIPNCPYGLVNICRPLMWPVLDGPNSTSAPYYWILITFTYKKADTNLVIVALHHHPN